MDLEKRASVIAEALISPTKAAKRFRLPLADIQGLLDEYKKSYIGGDYNNSTRIKRICHQGNRRPTASDKHS